MSLINDALKKAQAQQRSAEATREALPSQAPSAQPTYVQPAKQGPGVIAILLMIVVVASLVGGAVALVMIGFGGESADADQAPPPSTITRPDPQLTAADSSQDLDPVRFETLQPETAEEPPPLPEPSPPVAESAPAAEPAPPEADASTSVPAGGGPPQPNPEILAYLGNVEVRGIMAKTKRVLLFDGATGRTDSYGEGEYFNLEQQVRVHQISSQGIIFIDHVGVTYIKYF